MRLFLHELTVASGEKIPLVGEVDSQSEQARHGGNRHLKLAEQIARILIVIYCDGT